MIEQLRNRLERWYLCLDRRTKGAASLLVRTALAFDRNDGPLVARSIAYYALFAIFPAILALVVVFSAVLGSEEVQAAVMAVVTEYLPLAVEVVAANIEQLIETRETVGLIALVGLVWSASGVFSALFRAVNRAWGIPKSKLVVRDKLYGMLMMVLVGAFFVLTLITSPIVSIARTWRIPLLGWQFFAEPGSDRLAGVLSALVPALLSAGAFILMYRTMPRTRVTWRDVWLGGLVTGLIWELGKQLFAWHVSTFAMYNLIYGSLGAAIAFLLWSYLTAQMVLLGAAFTAEYSRWRRGSRPRQSTGSVDLTAREGP